MKLYRNVRLTRKTLFAHKLRTFLSLAGITIGVAAVIIMVAVGRGAEREVVETIKAMGTNLLVVNAGKSKAFAGRESRSGSVNTLTLEDAEAILEACPSVMLAAPAQDRTLAVKYGNASVRTKVLGTTPDFPRIRNYELADGEGFTFEDQRAAFRTAVIGWAVFENLFGGEDPVGETIRIGKVPFRVAGVLGPKGLSSEGANEDNVIVIPVTTALRRVFNLDHIDTIYVRVRRQELMGRAEEEIRALLRERHRLDRRDRPDDFTIQNQVTSLRAEEAARESFTLLVTGIAAISLAVGGIGILAVMLLAVSERTNEIGLRMAIGARRRDILAQFLAEALILGLAGGVGGVLLGVAAAAGLGWATRWETVIPLDYAGWSVLVSLSVGLFFGVYPARRASLLQPIEALRAE